MDDCTKIKIRRLCFRYRDRAILQDITAAFQENTVTAIVGPSGTGKSTFLMTLNRLWVMSGEVEIKFRDRFRNIYAPSFSPAELRRSVGMVFQSPNPLPMSIFGNVAFPLKLAGIKEKTVVRGKVEGALKRAFLWDEVHERLGEKAMKLSGGQQQRLCIARALVLEPEVLLLDEPTSSLDATAGAVIEKLLTHLKNQCTILVVSHYLDQVRRIADRVLELANGTFIQRNV